LTRAFAWASALCADAVDDTLTVEPFMAWVEAVYVIVAGVVVTTTHPSSLTGEPLAQTSPNIGCSPITSDIATDSNRAMHNAPLRVVFAGHASTVVAAVVVVAVQVDPESESPALQESVTVAAVVAVVVQVDPERVSDPLHELVAVAAVVVVVVQVDPESESPALQEYVVGPVVALAP
jgi:hypothetical protein